MISFLFGTLVVGIILVAGSLLVMALIPAVINAVWRAIFGK